MAAINQKRNAPSIAIILVQIQYQEKSARLNYLQFDPDNAKKAKAFAEELNIRFNEDADEIVKYLGQWLIKENFKYSLKPNQNSSINIDRFLFQSKTGYCEHYASSIGFILRTAHIPTRVVIGYQGGNFNSYLKTYTINSNDAHAWLEYWDGKKWKLFDPTYYIAPDRINLGMTQYLRDSNRSENSFTEFTKLVSFLIRDYSKLGITFIAFHWKNLSSNFDNTPIISEILIFISENYSQLALLALLIMLYLYMVYFKKEETTTGLILSYLLLAERKGYKKTADEGYKEFFEKVSLNEPSIKTLNNKFMSIWLKHHYTNTALGKSDISEMKGLLKEIEKTIRK